MAPEAPQGTAPRQASPPSSADGERSTPEVLSAAARLANGRKEDFTTEEVVDALEWFLSDVDEGDEVHEFQINIGTMKHKRWVTWGVRPVDPDKIRRIRRASQGGNRLARRTGQGEFDEVQANVAIVVEGTVEPNVRAAAKDKGLVAPEDWVKAKFRHKPGLLTQIAGEIMACSGYDDDDIREVDAAQG